MMVRTFICIEIPASITGQIDRLQKHLRQFEAHVSWTKPSNIHLTLKFLGDVETARIELVSKAVERAASGIDSFEIEIGGTGCFPSPRSPKVLWVGISSVPEPLRKLYAKIEEELEREGFSREKRKFSPHLTIGRIRAPQNAVRIAEALISSGFQLESFKATEIIVMRSDLKPTGSVYTRQAVVRFQ